MGIFTINYTPEQGSAFVEACVNGKAGIGVRKTEIADPNDPEGDPIPNPETQVQFALRAMQTWVTRCVIANGAEKAQKSAREQAITDATALMEGLFVK